MKLVALIFAAELLAVGAAQAQDPRLLLQKYKCSICHADDASKTGAAYVDIAAKYRGNTRAVSILTAVVTRGEHGAGPWHMPPHPEVPEADARKMVRYILSLGK